MRSVGPVLVPGKTVLSSTHLPVSAPLGAPPVRARRSSGRIRVVAARTGDRVFTLEEVRARGHVVVGDDVLDLERFDRRHPGGAFLAELAGTDATLALRNAHGKSRVVGRMLASLRIGRFDTATREPLDRDVLALARRYREEGLFDYPRSRLVLDVVRWVALFAVAVAALRIPGALPVAFALVLAGTIDVVWWIHDAGHDAVFADERRARRVIEALGILVLGMPQEGYHYGVHRRHHGFTNVVGVDQALRTGPLTWDLHSAASQHPLFRHLRLAQWFLLVVPAAGPALLVEAVAYAVRRRQWLVVLAVAVRWSFLVVLAHHAHALPLVVAPWVAGSILAFMAGLNHFHMPISTATPTSYARSVFERTQNVAAGPVWRWISGGLDLHVEHHLFPTMPSFRYARIAADVRALAAKHALPYHLTTRTGAVASLCRALLAPLRVPTPAGALPSPVSLRAEALRGFEAVLAVTVRALAILLPVVVALGVEIGGAAAFAGAFVVFVVLGVVELVLHLSPLGLREPVGHEDPRLLRVAPVGQLRAYAVLHLVLVPYVVARMASGLDPVETLGACLSLAAMGGSVGGLAGHELFHRRGFVDVFLGEAVYGTAGYAHFAASHLAGHHVNAGRRGDWSTARRGESIYAFILRAMVDGFRGGVRLERERLRRRGRSPWTLANGVLRSVVASTAIVVLLAWTTGARGVVLWLVTSLLTISFKELFNYISHYGLVRDDDGESKARMTDLTWESDNKVVNWFIFNAGRHCHHHERPAHGHDRLALRHAKAFIPHGIPLMALYAFVPPLYLRAMERILRARSGS